MNPQSGGDVSHKPLKTCFLVIINEALNTNSLIIKRMNISAALKRLAKRIFKKPKKPTWRDIASYALIAVLLIVFVAGVWWAYSIGSTASWADISETEKNLRDLFSNSTQAQLRNWLPAQKMNFTDGLIWESRIMTYTENRPTYQNVIQVLKNGKGACGEFVWVFGAFCVANDIPFRIVTVGYFSPNVVDHAWAQVNPSHDGKTWIHVEVTDTCDQIRNGNTIDSLWNLTINNDNYYKKYYYQMVLAYQLNDNGEITITDVTSTFS